MLFRGRDQAPPARRRAAATEGQEEQQAEDVFHGWGLLLILLIVIVAYYKKNGKGATPGLWKISRKNVLLFAGKHGMMNMERCTQKERMPKRRKKWAKTKNPLDKPPCHVIKLRKRRQTLARCTA